MTDLLEIFSSIALSITLLRNFGIAKSYLKPNKSSNSYMIAVLFILTSFLKERNLVFLIRKLFVGCFFGRSNGLQLQ